jgi:hypothetical protein
MKPQPAAPKPSPSTPKPVAISQNTTVSFSGLMTGIYPVHLHSACSGSQNFHIAVEQSLVVGSNGRGSILVASSTFGRGLCLIVYGSFTLARVLTVRRI